MPTFATATRSGATLDGSQDLLRGKMPQARSTQLEVGPPGDRFEREADQVAERVMRAPEPSAPPGEAPPWIAAATGAARVQRMCAGCEKEDEKLRGKPIGSSLAASPEIGERIQTSRGGGAPLPPSTRAFFEPRLGHDFGGVRVHTDGEAQAMAGELQASAFTVGRDLYFNAGRYAPSTDSGRRLIAHELTHVVQQSAGGAPPAIQRQYCPGGNCHTPNEELRKRPVPDWVRQWQLFPPTPPPRNNADPSECCNPALCSAPDDRAGAKGNYTLTLAVDREKPTVREAVKEGGVGHAWVKLKDAEGHRYSYGMWPQNTLGRNFLKTVPGCIHHADKLHEPPNSEEYLDISYNLTQPNFQKALSLATAQCTARPSYNLLSYNCTSFATQVAREAGVTPPASVTTIIPWFLTAETPNALFEGMQDDKKKRGEDPNPIISPIKPPPHGAAAGTP